MSQHNHEQTHPTEKFNVFHFCTRGEDCQLSSARFVRVNPALLRQFPDTVQQAREFLFFFFFGAQRKNCKYFINPTNQLAFASGNKINGAHLQKLAAVSRIFSLIMKFGFQFQRSPETRN